MYKKIKGYDNYFINEEGYIYSDNGKRKRYLKGSINKDGYVRVGLTKDGKTKEHLVHRLVAQTFIPNKENKPYVNHINGIKDDNRVENLEWCTQNENMQHKIYVLGETPIKTSSKKCKIYNKGIFEIECASLEDACVYLNYTYGYSYHSLRKYFNCGYHSIILE